MIEIGEANSKIKETKKDQIDLQEGINNVAQSKSHKDLANQVADFSATPPDSLCERIHLDK